jgi:hypothetical protein
MKGASQRRSRSARTHIVYIKKEEVGYSQYVAARVIVLIIIIVVLLGSQSFDWKMFLNFLWAVLDFL